jgi:hypothetical protein
LTKASLLESVPHFAEGGIVLAPTLGLLGEAGPERVEPLDPFESRAGRSQYNTLYVNVTIGNIAKEVSLEEVEETVIDGVVKAVDRMG